MNTQSGRIASVTVAAMVTLPAALSTTTSSPSTIPRSVAGVVWIQTEFVGTSSCSRRLFCVENWVCWATLPVSR